MDHNKTHFVYTNERDTDIMFIGNSLEDITNNMFWNQLEH